MGGFHIVRIELDSVHYERNICEVLQEIKGRLEKNDAGLAYQRCIMKDVEVALIMAKKMGVKLKTYKYDWDRGMWHKNVDYVTDILNRFPRWQFPYHYARYHINGIIRRVLRV